MPSISVGPFGRPQTHDVLHATLEDYAVLNMAVVMLHGLEWLPQFGADAYACACGWAHDPKYNGKHPIGKGWQQLDGVRPIEETIARVEAYQKQTAHKPGYFTWPNFGVHLRASGLICLDCDPRNGGDTSLAELLAKHGGLPVTAQDRSGNRLGGGHWFFRAPPSGVLPDAKKIPNWMPGLDLLQGNNQVVIPPSLHPHGRHYEWIHDPREVGFAPLPEFIIDLVRKKCEAEQQAEQERLAAVEAAARKAAATVTYSIGERAAPPVGIDRAHIVERARKYIAPIGPAIDGQGGSKVTCNVACKLIIGFGLSQSEALPLFEEWNLLQAKGPWTTPELIRKLEWAETQGGVRGYLLAQSARCGRHGVDAELAHLDGINIVETMSGRPFGTGTSEPFDEEAFRKSWEESLKILGADLARERAQGLRPPRPGDVSNLRIVQPDAPKVEPPPDACRKARVRLQHLEHNHDERVLGMPCGCWSCEICLPWKKMVTIARMEYHLKRDSLDGLAFVGEVADGKVWETARKKIASAGGRYGWVKAPCHDRAGTRLVVATRPFLDVNGQQAEDMPVEEALDQYRHAVNSIALRDGSRDDHPVGFCRAWHDLEIDRERTGEWRVKGKLELPLPQFEQLLSLLDIPYRRLAHDMGTPAAPRQGWVDLHYTLPGHWGVDDLATWDSWCSTGAVPWKQIEESIRGWRAEPFRPSQLDPSWEAVVASP